MQLIPILARSVAQTEIDHLLILIVMKKSYSSDNPSPSKVVIVPKPPKSQSSDSTSIPTPVKSVLNEDVLKDVKGDNNTATEEAK